MIPVMYTNHVKNYRLCTRIKIHACSMNLNVRNLAHLGSPSQTLLPSMNSPLGCNPLSPSQTSGRRALNTISPAFSIPYLAATSACCTTSTSAMPV